MSAKQSSAERVKNHLWRLITGEEVLSDEVQDKLSNADADGKLFLHTLLETNSETMFIRAAISLYPQVLVTDIVPILSFMQGLPTEKRGSNYASNCRLLGECYNAFRA